MTSPLGEFSQSFIIPMDPITEAQLTPAFSLILTMPDNIIKTTNTWIRRLDRVSSHLTPQTEKWWKSLIALPNPIGLEPKSLTQR